jgi:predicted RNase H-like nuclease
MPEHPLFVGAVWSGECWFAVGFDGNEFDHAAAFDELGDLWARYEETTQQVLVDVPIGLIDEGSERRPCDRLAREVLGSRASTVVAPPVREATRKRRYPAANRVHRRKTDSELGEAAFAISDAVAAVDLLLQNVPEARPVFAEAHPEVCFRAFAGEELAHDPDLAGGYAERMRTLAGHDRDAPPVVQAAGEAAGGAAVTVSDVLGAVALAYTARPGPAELRSLPPDPTTDAQGLPMRMVYRSDDPLEPA